jgi:hypothetical protein
MGSGQWEKRRSVQEEVVSVEVEATQPSGDGCLWRSAEVQKCREEVAEWRSDGVEEREVRGLRKETMNMDTGSGEKL